MALTKIKINEVTTKATPVLADSVLISDSEDDGRGKISTLTDLQTLIGGGAVDSVAGKTGVVTLDASDIAETAALKIMTADERTKLAGIAENAEVNTVNSVAGKTGDVTLDADDVAPTSTKLWMSDTQSSKLAGITEGANNYTHPATHPQSMIEGLADALAGKQNASNAVTTDTTQTITGVKTFDNNAPLKFARASGGYYAFQFFFETLLQWRWYQTGNYVTIQHFDSDGNYVEVMRFSHVNKRVEFNISPTVPTATASNNSTLAASTAFVQAQKASPALTGTPTAPTAAAGTNTTQLATTAFVQAATASAIYDLPVTRTGLVSAGTNVVLLETGVLDPAWYDETHVLNVSFFARNDSGINGNATFNVQLYDEGTSTAHTIASITAYTVDYRLLQASIYRASSSSVNCNIEYGYVSGSGYVSLAAGSYKLRVVCTSTLSTIFGAAQVRFTK